jgi:ubiquinone biosynthesis protein
VKDPKREIENIERFKEILTILGEQGFYHLLAASNLAKHVPTSKKIVSRQKSGPARLEETIEELGTTFIKFGQIMSERPDIVPEKYIEELKALQDSVEEFDHEEAKRIVDEEIGLENFEHFEEDPIASASIAQVHRARLKDGDDVIVKIRRPGIKYEVERDLEILGYLSKKAERHNEKLRDLRIADIVNEFSKWTRKELNFLDEASNARTFRKNLEGEEKLDVPKVYSDLVTKKVLTMEYVEGVKVTNTEALDDMDIETEDLARTTIRSGFKQVVRDGFFHADPHPSNFLIREDGSIVYLDFGMMGRISKEYRDKIDLLFLYAMREEGGKALEVVQEMGWTEKDANIKAIETKMNDIVMRIQNSTLKETQISEEFLDLFIFCGKNGLHLPLELTLMAKNLITLEGIGLTVCPDFKPSKEYEEVGKKMLKEQNRPQDMAESAFLDMVENKEMIESPFTTFKEYIDQGQNSNPTEIENEIELNFVPTLLVLTSGLLMIASIYEQKLLYIGLLELAVGLYLYSNSN